VGKKFGDVKWEQLSPTNINPLPGKKGKEERFERFRGCTHKMHTAALQAYFYLTLRVGGIPSARPIKTVFLTVVLEERKTEVEC